MKERYYRIGELAKLAGVSQRTVDYYTRLGLISPMQRTEGNYRIYDEVSVQRLRLIKVMQAQRLPLSEIAVRLGGSVCEAACDIVEQVQAIGQDLAKAERQLAELGTVVANSNIGEDVRRTLSKTAGEALLRTLILAQCLAALAGDSWPSI